MKVYKKITIQTIIICLLLLFFSFFDSFVNVPLFQTGYKMLLIFYLLGNYKIKKSSNKYIYLAFIPILLSFFMNYGTINKIPSIIEIIANSIVILTTAIFEELYFRLYLNSRFDKKISLEYVLFITLLFSLSHIINIFFFPVVDVLLQIVFTFFFGLFQTSLYLQNKNIKFCIFFHFIMNFIQIFFNLYSKRLNLFSYYLFFEIIVIYLAFVSLKLLKGYES